MSPQCESTDTSEAQEHGGITHNLISAPPIGLVFTYIGLTNNLEIWSKTSFSLLLLLYQSDSLQLRVPQLRDSILFKLATHQCKLPKLPALPHPDFQLYKTS